MLTVNVITTFLKRLNSTMLHTCFKQDFILPQQALCHFLGNSEVCTCSQSCDHKHQFASLFLGWKSFISSFLPSSASVMLMSICAIQRKPTYKNVCLRTLNKIEIWRHVLLPTVLNCLTKGCSAWKHALERCLHVFKVKCREEEKRCFQGGWERAKQYIQHKKREGKSINPTTHTFSLKSLPSETTDGS